MNFLEALRWITDHDMISISEPNVREYIWQCCAVAGALGPLVEVGSAYGGTTALMALAAGRNRSVVSVDNWQCGQREVFERNMAQLANGVNNVASVSMRIGESTPLASTFDDRSLGYVMIDATHTGPAPFNDVRAYAPKVARGGFLVMDAVANGHPDVTRAMARWLADDVSARRFRFDADFQRIESCSAHHAQTVAIGFRAVD